MTGSGKPASPAGPLHAPEIDALFDGWRSYRRVALAVSGGADSMALLVLAHDWSLRQNAPPALTVLTVDHGLRLEAADEAAWVAAQAARLGLPHHTLRWTEAKPQSGLQAEARAARYDLMLAFCREAGIGALATAHTANDQAETMLMRLARGSGLDGVAAIPPVSERGGVKLLRPLLAVERASLEAFLRARGASWLDDPSNRDQRYERIRLRDAMRNARGLQLAPEKLALTARRLQRARVALEAATRAFTDVALEVHPAGFGEISLGRLLAQPEEIGLRTLSHMAEVFGGGVRPVRLARIEALYAALAGGSESAATATLGGCIFTVRRGVLRAMREFGRIDPARDPLPASGAILWDGRFAISVPGEDGLMVGPLGPEGRAILRSLGGRMALPARIAHALPALWRGHDLVFTPFATFIERPPVGWLVEANVTFQGNERRK